MMLVENSEIWDWTQVQPRDSCLNHKYKLKNPTIIMIGIQGSTAVKIKCFFLSDKRLIPSKTLKTSAFDKYIKTPSQTKTEYRVLLKIGSEEVHHRDFVERSRQPQRIIIYKSTCPLRASNFSLLVADDRLQ